MDEALWGAEVHPAGEEDDFASLPGELIYLISTYCSFPDLVNAQLVCKRWQSQILASTDLGNHNTAVHRLMQPISFRTYIPCL